MPRPALRVTPAELSVLDVLWDGGSSSIGALRDAIYPGQGSTKFATVQKLLARLEAKKLVERRRGGEVQLFAAIVERDALIGHELSALASRLGSGSLAPLATTLVARGQLTAEERDQLIELLKSAPVRPSPGNPEAQRKRPNQRETRKRADR